MATYVPAKRATAYAIAIGLESVATAGAFQANPTLASGDFKVSKDGGSLTNLVTLPTVTPSGGKIVQIALSSTEMDADNVTVVCSDASGGEWKDLIINIQTTARQIDDLATTTATDTIAGYLDTEVAAIKAKTDNLPASPAAVGSAMTLASGAITSSVIATDAITATGLAASAVSEIQSGLSTLTAAQVRSEMDSNSTQLAKLGTPAGVSVSADIAAVKVDTAAILADTGTDGVVISTAQMQTLADIVLGRSVSGIDSSASTHSLYELIQAILESSTASGSWVIKKTDGSTTFNTRTLVTDGSALPIVGVS